MKAKSEGHSQDNNEGDPPSLYLSHSCEDVLSFMVHEVNTYNKLVEHWTSLLYEEPNLDDVQLASMSPQKVNVRDVLEQVLMHSKNISKVMEAAKDYVQANGGKKTD